MQIPNAVNSVALTFVSKYKRLSRENAGTGAASLILFQHLHNEDIISENVFVALVLLLPK